MTDYSARLAAARQLLAHARPLPGPVADQISAANRDTATAFMRAAGVFAATEPGATLVVGGPPTDPASLEVLARLLAALLGCQPCPHLALGPRPAVANLGTRRLDCHDCPQPEPPPTSRRSR